MSMMTQGFYMPFAAAHGFRIPQDIGIVGADDSARCRQVVRPYLSGVRMPRNYIGYDAAMWHQHCSGKPSEQRCQLIAPYGVHGRESTMLTSGTGKNPIAEGFKLLKGNLANIDVYCCQTITSKVPPCTVE